MENQEWNANPKEQYYNGSKNTFEINTGNDGECVAEVIHGFENALLMAASNEMYFALKEMERVYNEKGQLLAFNVSIALEAIRKAEGK